MPLQWLAIMRSCNQLHQFKTPLYYNMNQKEIAANVTAYETSGKLLTHPHVHCTCCNGATTMFGSKVNDNLHKRIMVYGGLATLLSTFKCRACAKGAAPVMIKAAAPVMRAIDVAVSASPDVEYASKDVAHAAQQLSAEDCAKIFVMMPNGKMDYWWRHPHHYSQSGKGTTGVTITHEDGSTEHRP